MGRVLENIQDIANVESQVHLQKSKSYPIMADFLPGFSRCATGCTYSHVGIMGDLRHQQKKSCHNTGSAIDLKAIQCEGVHYPVNSERFQIFLSCMRNQSNIYVIFGNKEHKHHAHISLRSCEVDGDGKIKGRRRASRLGKR